MIIPSVVVKQVDGSERQFDIYSRLLNQNLVFLNGPVTDESAASIVAQIMHINESKNNVKISLYINSPGGSVTAGLAIVDAMNLCSNIIETTVIGQACSMGAVILANGTPGHRYALEHSRVMIHQPSGGSQGTFESMENTLEEMSRLKDILYKILAKKTGNSLEKVTEDCKTDYFMSPDESEVYGIVDKVVKEQ